MELSEKTNHAYSPVRKEFNWGYPINLLIELKEAISHTREFSKQGRDSTEKYVIDKKSLKKLRKIKSRGIEASRNEREAA